MTSSESHQPQRRLALRWLQTLLAIGLVCLLARMAAPHVFSRSPTPQTPSCDSSDAESALDNYKDTIQRRFNNFFEGYMAIATEDYINLTVTITRITYSDLSETGYDPATRARGCTANIEADISAMGRPIPISKQMKVGYVISPSQGTSGTARIVSAPYDYVVARYAPDSIKDLAAPIGASTVTSVFMAAYSGLRNEALNTWTVYNAIPSGPCTTQNINDNKYKCPLFIEAQAVDENNVPHPAFLPGYFVFTLQEDHRWVLDEESLNDGFQRALIEDANHGTRSREDILGIIQRQL